MAAPSLYTGMDLSAALLGFTLYSPHIRVGCGSETLLDGVHGLQKINNYKVLQDKRSRIEKNRRRRTFAACAVFDFAPKKSPASSLTYETGSHTQVSCPSDTTLFPCISSTPSLPLSLWLCLSCSGLRGSQDVQDVSLQSHHWSSLVHPDAYNASSLHLSQSHTHEHEHTPPVRPYSCNQTALLREGDSLLITTGLAQTSKVPKHWKTTVIVL